MIEPALSPAPDPPPLGAHLSIAGGVDRAVERAIELGATALQIFLKNSNQWRGKPIAPGETARFRELVSRSGIAPPVAHSAYLINLASPDPQISQNSIQALSDELERARLLGVIGVIIHPGAHMGQGEAAGAGLVTERINWILAETAPNPAAIILELTAGQGTCLGYRFEQIAEMIESIEDKSRTGACLDTCHVFAAGYEMRTPEGIQETLRLFDETIGLDRLRVIHVNDSKTPFGARRDRHEHIGQGEIGEAGFAALLRDPRLRSIPFILETPKGDDLAEDRMNLATLRRLAIGRKPPSAA